jgi:Protein of unknown function (DUF669)
MQPPGKKLLRDIVRGSVDEFKKTWDATEASEGFPPLPSGTYRCLIAGGEMFRSNKNSTPGYKVTFEITSGALAGRKFWHSVWLTDKALAMAKADLAKLGITKLEQLEEPLPPGLLADVKVVVRTDDDGDTYNQVKNFQVVKSEVPAADFAPGEVAAPRTREPGDDDDLANDDDGFDWRNGTQSPVHANNGRGA